MTRFLRAPVSPVQISRRQPSMKPRHRRHRIATPQLRVGRRNHATTRLGWELGGEYERHRGTPFPPSSRTPGGLWPLRTIREAHPVANLPSVPVGTVGTPGGGRGGGKLGFPHPAAPPLAYSRDLPSRPRGVHSPPQGGKTGGLAPPPCSHPWRAHYSPPREGKEIRG